MSDHVGNPVDRDFSHRGSFMIICTKSEIPNAIHKASND